MLTSMRRKLSKHFRKPSKLKNLLNHKTSKLYSSPVTILSTLVDILIFKPGRY